PIEAEELLYDGLARLADGGRRAVVVIAGNHDSPDRLAAPAPLCARHGIHLLGMPGRSLAPLRLDLPCGERAVIAALPFPSDARLRSLLGGSKVNPAPGRDPSGQARFPASNPVAGRDPSGQARFPASNPV